MLLLWVILKWVCVFVNLHIRFHWNVAKKNICDLIFSFFFFLLFFIYNISMLDKKMLLFGDRYFDKISWSTSNFLNCFLPQNNIMICKKFTHFSSTNFRKYHENSLWMNVFINQSIFWIYEKYKHLATISCSYTFCFGIFDCEILYSWFFFCWCFIFIFILVL